MSVVDLKLRYLLLDSVKKKRRRKRKKPYGVRVVSCINDIEHSNGVVNESSKGRKDREQKRKAKLLSVLLSTMYTLSTLIEQKPILCLSLGSIYCHTHERNETKWLQF